jgi:hypothetical protein
MIKWSTTVKSVAQKNLGDVYHRFPQRNHSVLKRTNAPKTEEPFINKEAPLGKYWNKDATDFTVVDHLIIVLEWNEDTNTHFK